MAPLPPLKSEFSSEGVRPLISQKFRSSESTRRNYQENKRNDYDDDDDSVRHAEKEAEVEVTGGVFRIRSCSVKVKDEQ